MSGNGQNHQLRDAHEGAEDPAEDDDDFGEFEGFEGGIERMQAQPASSPWATFPDLLPVQTSPATPAEDGQGSSSRIAGAALREVWQPVPPSASWSNSNHEESRPLSQSMRTLNPPDVSLGTNQAIGGRVTPDNVHDAALAVAMDHMDGGVADARMPIAQIDLLTQQLESAERNRALLEEQVHILRQRNVELEQQISSSQNEINDLNARLQQNQETLEQRLSEMRELSSADWRQDLRQVQEEVAAIKQYLPAQKSELQTSINNLEEVNTRICNRLQSLESSLQNQYDEMEERLLTKFSEQWQQVKSTLEEVAHQTAQQVSGSLSQLICETVQNSNIGDHQGNNLLQSIKIELEKHKEQQKRVLREERRRQLVTISSALQSALQHFTCAINDDSELNDGDIS